MALTDILSAAVSGMAAAQSGLKTVSTNIANVGTPGYARERSNQSANVIAGRVTGVLVGEPTRVADKFLEAAVYRRANDLGQSEVRASYLDRLQAMLGAPGSEAGVPARLAAITKSAIAMTGSIGVEQNAADFVGRAIDAIGTIQTLDKDVETLIGDADSEVGLTVERINVLLKQIHALNDSISRTDGMGRSSAGSADQRNSAVEELSKLIAVTVREQPNGRITIETQGGAPLLDSRLRLLSYPSSKSSTGVAVADYPGIDIRFATESGAVGVSTGDRVESSTIGGKLGGLIELRDRALPNFRDQLGSLFTGLARALNGASNAASAIPPPVRLQGSTTALTGNDRLGFTGTAIFAVTDQSGKILARTDIDFDAMGAGATVADAIAQINAGMAGFATASMVDGQLTISAVGANRGVVVADDPADPSNRGGVSFSQYFGLNDIVRAPGALTAPSGFNAADPHGFDDGSTADVMLRDTNGRVIARATLTATAGGTMGDLLDQLNASPLTAYGSFSIDETGRFKFDTSASGGGTTISIPADSTDRYGTGITFSALSGLTGLASGLPRGAVVPELRNSPMRLPLALFDTTATVDQNGLYATDSRAAQLYVDSFAKVNDLGKEGNISLERYSTLILGEAGSTAANAQSRFEDASARMYDVVNRRDSYSGVNIDEELALMIVLQNSYSASARVVRVADEMYQALLSTVG